MQSVYFSNQKRYRNTTSCGFASAPDHTTAFCSKSWANTFAAARDSPRINTLGSPGH
jgi:hypothetical protein